ncbi:ATP-dependent DNA helicase pif1 [Plakobranchus ocellatus]|uniref:ATP-dependent DNA helicase n=1 Tax=Plakobranchus ocellatus TaxID=259542 RepID=A0AAV4DND6_9GAST|nr:ATP-dependent DNA helicase pif1 [Plakobranchus ocellatus]
MQMLKFCHPRDLLVNDGVSLGYNQIFEAISRTLQNMRGKESGRGTTALMTSECCQIPPSVCHGSRPQTVKTTFKSSYPWDIVRLLDIKKRWKTILLGIMLLSLTFFHCLAADLCLCPLVLGVVLHLLRISKSCLV